MSMALFTKAAEDNVLPFVVGEKGKKQLKRGMTKSGRERPSRTLKVQPVRDNVYC